MLLALFNTGESDETIAEDLKTSPWAVSIWRNSLGCPYVGNVGEEETANDGSEEPKTDVRAELRDRIRDIDPPAHTWLERNINQIRFDESVPSSGEPDPKHHREAEPSNPMTQQSYKKYSSSSRRTRQRAIRAKSPHQHSDKPSSANP